MSLGSLDKTVTTSSKVLTPSKKLSSNTVVNSCSMDVNRATMLRESTLRSPLRSALKSTSFTLRISRSRMTLSILVSI